MPTYAQSEESIRSGEPVEYVRFTLGNDVYRYTTSPITETLFSEDYEPIAMERSAPNLSPEITQNQITFIMPRNILLPAFFQRAAPRQSVFVIVYRKHRGEADGNAISYWQGAIDGISFKGENAELNCVGLESFLKRKGLRYRYSPRCRFFFTDGRCPVPQTAVQTETTIISASGSTITSGDFAAFADGWFKFGEVITPALESRFVVEHIGDTITLIAPFPTSPVGQLIKALAGCDYTPETCETKFGTWTDNGRDCGCFDTVPIINPFDKGVS